MLADHAPCARVPSSEGLQMPLTDEEIIELTPLCNCCRKRMTRIILPHTPWNESGDYLLHCKLSGKITRIENIEEVVRTGRQESPKARQ